MSRDWTRTLYPASFKGAAFFVETSDTHAGKRVVIHEFPGRDLPYNEELGAKATKFLVHAYVTGDFADVQATALIATMQGAGAGSLVLPEQGPVQVMALEGKRAFYRDRLGYLAIELDFVIDGGMAALTSPLQMAALTFDAVAAVGQAAAAMVWQLPIAGGPQWIADAAVVGLQDIPAALETVVATGALTPAQASPILSALQAALAMTPEVVSALTGVPGLLISPAPTPAETPVSWGDPTVVTSIPFATLVASIAAAPTQPSPPAPTAIFLPLGAASPSPPSAVLDLPTPEPASTLSVAAAFLAAVALFPSPGPPITSAPNEAIAQAVQDACARCGRALMLAGYAGALALVEWPDRLTASQARAQAVAAFDAALTDAADGAPASSLYATLSDLQARTLAALQANMLSLQPVMMAQADFGAPALYWAWRLYADPTRAQQIVDRNQLGHPAFVPHQFEALAA